MIKQTLDLIYYFEEITRIWQYMATHKVISEILESIKVGKKEIVGVNP